MPELTLPTPTSVSIARRLVEDETASNTLDVRGVVEIELGSAPIEYCLGFYAKRAERSSFSVWMYGDRDLERLVGSFLFAKWHLPFHGEDSPVFSSWRNDTSLRRLVVVLDWLCAPSKSEDTFEAIKGSSLHRAVQSAW